MSEQLLTMKHFPRVVSSADATGYSGSTAGIVTKPWELFVNTLEGKKLSIIVQNFIIARTGAIGE